MVIIPLILNGAIGAHLHVNFAVASRASFGFYLSRGAVVVRMITALFWHGRYMWLTTANPFFFLDGVHFTNPASSHPNLYRINSHDSDHSCHLAFVLGYHKQASRICRNHLAANVLPRTILEYSVPFSSDSTTQAAVVLCVQDGRCARDLCGDDHRSMCPGGRCG